MTRLLPTERQAALGDERGDVLVADRRAQQRDAGLLERQLETDVAHHRRDYGIAFQLTAAFEFLGAHQQDVVAVDQPARVIDQQGAVAVAIEGDPGAEAAVHDRFHQRLGRRRPAAAIDVAAVRSGVEDGHVEAQGPEQPRRRRRRGAVGAVDGDPHARERLRPGQRRAGVGQVVTDEVAGLDCRDRIARHRP